VVDTSGCAIASNSAAAASNLALRTAPSHWCWTIALEADGHIHAEAGGGIAALTTGKAAARCGAASLSSDQPWLLNAFSTAASVAEPKFPSMGPL
jgi:hypothetical protein